MSWSYTGGMRRQYSRQADFAWMSNEDQGWIATLVTNTNDNEEFSKAYVASIDLFEETEIFEAVETMHHNTIPTQYHKSNGLIVLGLLCWYSMLDKPLTATFQGAGADTEDETMKTFLGGPYFVGQNHFGKSEAGANDSIAYGGQLDHTVHNHWTPPQNMRARTPIFKKLTNVSAAVAETTGILTEASHANFENYAERDWWRPSRLRSRERRAVADVIKYQLIDT